MLQRTVLKTKVSGLNPKAQTGGNVWMPDTGEERGPVSGMES